MQAPPQHGRGKPMFAPPQNSNPLQQTNLHPLINQVKDNRGIRCPQSASTRHTVRCHGPFAHSGSKHRRSTRAEQVEEPAESERPRFGMDLINRMSGGSESAPKTQQASVQPAMARQPLPKASVHRNRKKLKFLHSCVVRQTKPRIKKSSIA